MKKFLPTRTSGPANLTPTSSPDFLRTARGEFDPAGQSGMTGFTIPRLYAIIDTAFTGVRSHVAVCEALFEAGVKLIQFRAKHATTRQLYEKCLEIAPHCR